MDTHIKCALNVFNWQTASVRVHRCIEWLKYSYVLSLVPIKNALHELANFCNLHFKNDVEDNI